MGEAKRRGTFEERKAQSVERKAVESAEFMRKWQEQQDAMTPQQRKRRLSSQLPLVQLMAMASTHNFR